MFRARQVLSPLIALPVALSSRSGASALFLALMLSAEVSQANPVLNPGASNTQVESQLMGPGLTITPGSLSVVTGQSSQYGTFANGDTPSGAGPTLGIDSGVFMTTSRATATNVATCDDYPTCNTESGVNAVLGPNNDGFVSDPVGTTYSDPQLTGVDTGAIYDPVILQLRSTPAGAFMKFSFVFASEEYPEYVCSIFNDAFGFFVKPTSQPDIPSNWTNVGVLPGTSTPIAVNTINGGVCGAYGTGVPTNLGNSAYYVDNGDGTTPGSNANLQYDGYTIPFIVDTPVTPGVEYDVKLAIADSGDEFWDGAVFLNWISSSNFAEDADLELDLTVDNATPEVGDTVTFTLDVTNTGQDAVSSVQVDFDLPTGFAHSGGTAGANYNPANGIWTVPGTLAATGGTQSVTITATVGGLGGSVDAYAQVATMGANDVDSTPGNGTAPTVAEDDEDAVSLTVPPVDASDGPVDNSTAPDGTPAATAYGQATHTIQSGIQLGATNDADASSIASPNADGDGAEDDGVFLDAGLATNLQNANLQQEDGVIFHIPVTGTGILYAWADWDRNGTFGNNPNELIANAVAGNDETLAVATSVPLSAGNGQTFMRFRWSSDTAAASPSGAASDGEVEDYAVTIGSTVTPNPTPANCVAGYLTETWSANGSGGYQSTTSEGVTVTANATAPAGANWSFTPNDTLNSSGMFGDASLNGIASLSTVFSWDTSPEDGRNTNANSDGVTGVLTFTFSDPVRNPVLYIDRIGGYGGDSAASPQALSNSALITPNAASSSVTFSKIAGTTHLEVTGTTIQRSPNEMMFFGEGTSESGTDTGRNTAMGGVQLNGQFTSVSLDFNGVGVEGAGADGIEFVWCADGIHWDYSDAPANYGDPDHEIVDGIQLGATVTAETSGYNDTNAAADSDDGVNAVFLAALAPGQSAMIPIGVAGAGGFLQAWIDWNGNGTFDSPVEQIATDLQDTDGDGIINIPISVPSWATTAQTFARFRWSTDFSIGPDGAASDGEVEDYALTVGAGGSVLSGILFLDNGIGGDTAHDGLIGTNEAGAALGTVPIFDGAGAQIATGVVNPDGTWEAILPVGYAGAVRVDVTAISDHRTISEDLSGVPGAINPDTSDGTFSFNAAAGVSYSGIHIGLIEQPTLTQDQSASVAPGQIVDMPHVYTATTSGDVSFALVDQVANPARGFTTAILTDANCDGTADGTLPATISVTVGQNICVVVRTQAGSGISPAARFSFGIEATTAYTGTVVLDTQRNNDALGSSGKGEDIVLRKLVANITKGSVEAVSNAADIGDVLQYRIVMKNPGPGAAANVTVSDRTPSYTELASPIPSPVTVAPGVSCSVVTPTTNVVGYSGAIKWSCPGSIPAGTESSLTFQIKITP